MPNRSWSIDFEGFCHCGLRSCLNPNPDRPDQYGENSSVLIPQQQHQILYRQINQEIQRLEIVADCIKTLIDLRQQQLQETLRNQVFEGIRQLEVLADCINAQATQKEDQLLQFREIAIDIDRSCHALQQDFDRQRLAGLEPSKCICCQPASVWKVRDLGVPEVVRRGPGFILMTKAINLREQEDDFWKRARIAQQRREALEHWLKARRIKQTNS